MNRFARMALLMPALLKSFKTVLWSSLVPADNLPVNLNYLADFINFPRSELPVSGTNFIENYHIEIDETEVVYN